MDHSAAASEQTARTVFWIIMGTAAAFIAAVLLLIR